VRQAQAAVAEERAHIARELHDMLAHSLVVVVIQAEAAEEMLDRDPQRAPW
jgi:signal transduction histidine kinase